MAFPLSTSKTFCAFNKIISDVKRLCRAYEIILQVVFILFYGYSIYANVHNPILLTVNAVLLALAIGYFVFDLCTHNSKSKTVKKVVRKNVSRTYRYSKLAIRLFTIGLSIYEIVSFSAPPLKIFATAFTIICFALQIIFEVVRIVIEKYFNLIMHGIKMDYEAVKNSNVGKTITEFTNPKLMLAKAIDKPICDFAKKMNVDIEEESAPTVTYSKQEAKNRTILSKLAKENEETEKLSNAEKLKEKERLASEKFSKVKSHLASIFKKKK